MLMIGLTNKPFLWRMVLNEAERHFPLVTPLERIFILSTQVCDRQLPAAEVKEIKREVDVFLGLSVPQTLEEKELYKAACLSAAMVGSVVGAEKYLAHCKESDQPALYVKSAQHYLFSAYVQEGKFEQAWEFFTVERSSLEEGGFVTSCLHEGLKESIKRSDTSQQKRFVEEMIKMDAEDAQRESVRIYAQGAVSLMNSTV